MQITTLANHVRKDLIRHTKTGLADTLGSADIFATILTFLEYTPFNKKDRIICTPRLYPSLRTTLAHMGHFSKNNLQKNETTPHENIATAIGRALAIFEQAKQTEKTDQSEQIMKVYYVMSDEDHNGLSWDAIHFAGNQKIPNIITIIDRNNIQKEGNTEEIHPLEPLRQKYEAFGWKVAEVDGHHANHLIHALEEARQSDRPFAIIAHTTSGKGVQSIENRHEWTHKQPTDAQKLTFIETLK